MKKLSSDKKAILLGNGINYLSTDSIGWNDILEQLKNLPVFNQINHEVKNVDLKNPLKPFPLAYEEIRNILNQNNKSDIDRVLKKRIVSNIFNQLKGRKGFNKFHNRLINTNAEHFLTTNYDYGLQLSQIPDFIETKKRYSINNLEKKKNINRGYKLKSGKVIWHIHGELLDNRNIENSTNEYPEQSILIGNESYGQTISNINDYIKGKRDSKSSIPMHERIINGRMINSWIQLFFTHDIYIIGLGLDFVEQDIWWIINYRVNKKNYFKTKGILINNKITFLYADIEKSKIDLIKEIKTNKNELADKKITKWLNDQIDFKKNKAKAEVMKAMDIINKPIKCKNHAEFFEIVIRDYF